MLRAGPELSGRRAAKRLRPVTHRKDAHADWGLQQARHLEPSHPAAAGAGAGAGTFDSRLLGQPQLPLKKVRQVDENGPRSRHRWSTARARRAESKGKPHQRPPYESSSQKRQLLSAWVRGGSAQQFPHAQRRSAGPTCGSRWAEPQGRSLMGGVLL